MSTQGTQPRKEAKRAWNSIQTTENKYKKRELEKLGKIRINRDDYEYMMTWLKTEF